jgi:hypothetical protein
LILTGKASAVTVGGTQIVPLGEYTLRVNQASEEYTDLASAAKNRIPTFKDWELDLKMMGTLKASTYGTVSAGPWNGVYLKEWKSSVKGDVAEAPQQALDWIDRVFTGLDWEVEATKYVDSATKNQFLSAVAASSALVQVRTPVLVGNAAYGDSETKADDAPREEQLTFGGSGMFTAGVYFSSIVNKFITYATQLTSTGYVTPEAVAITNVLTGSAFLQDFEAASDGSKLEISLKLAGTGQCVLL